MRNEKNQQNKEARLEVQAMFLRNVAQSAIFTALQLTGPHGSLSLSTLRGQDSSVTTGTRLRPGQPGFDSSRDSVQPDSAVHRPSYPERQVEIKKWNCPVTGRGSLYVWELAHRRQ